MSKEEIEKELTTFSGQTFSDSKQVEAYIRGMAELKPNKGKYLNTQQ